MKSAVYSLVALLGLLLPICAAAQTDQTASTRQLSSETLAVATPPNSAEAPAAERISRLYTGTVLNEKGQPLAGALVTLGADKDQLTVTNADGSYLLRSKEAVPMLRVTYAGYEDAELSLSNPQPVTFNMEPVSDYKRQLKKQSKAAVKAFYNK
jgi:hypothetical protein